MSEQTHASHETDAHEKEAAPHQHNTDDEKGKKPPEGGIDRHPGGKGALGTKENLLAPYFDEMVEVGKQLAGQFTPLGLHFRPQVLLATAMQEAANKDPLDNRSFDNGLGLMQI